MVNTVAAAKAVSSSGGSAGPPHIVLVSSMLTDPANRYEAVGVGVVVLLVGDRVSQCVGQQVVCLFVGWAAARRASGSLTALSA